MYNVSEQYREQMNKNIRNPSYIRVNFGIITPDASSQNTMSDNGHLFYSNLDNVDYGSNVEKRYLTFEHNKFILDGENLLPPEVGANIPYYQGYVSDIMSDENGDFITPPIVTIDFQKPFSFIGLTFRFNKYFNNYPSEFDVIAYLEGNRVFITTAHPQSSEFVLDTPIPFLGFCDKLEFVFKKTFPVRRRLELEYIMFGINATFTDSDITNSTWTRDIDLLSTKLPINDFEFTIIDPEKNYNPENTTGVWRYLEDRQPIFFQYGYELDSGVIEWVDGSNLFSNGEIRVDGNSTLSTVTFKSTSLLASQDAIYYKGIYKPEKTTLYDLALDVLDFADLPLLTGGIIPYVLDESLKDIETSVPIPEMKVKEILQLIANAGRCILFTNRIGQIEMKRMGKGTSHFTLDFNNMIGTPSLNKSPYLLQVQTFINNISLENGISEVHKSDINFSEPTECLLKYDASTNLHITTSSGLHIVGEPTFYGSSCLVTLEGTGTAHIYGNKLIFHKTGVTYDATPTGFVCPIENALLDDEEDTEEYAEWIAEILTKRNEYTVGDRGYPELDVGDIISTQTPFANHLSSVVLGSKIRYNGALSGEIKFLSLESALLYFKYSGMFRSGEEWTL